LKAFEIFVGETKPKLEFKMFKTEALDRAGLTADDADYADRFLFYQCDPRNPRSETRANLQNWRQPSR